MKELGEPIVTYLQKQGYEVFRNGWPDLFFIRGTHLLLIEIKKRKVEFTRTRNKNQQHTIKALVRSGIDVYVWIQETQQLLLVNHHGQIENAQLPDLLNARRHPDYSLRDWLNWLCGATGMEICRLIHAAELELTARGEHKAVRLLSQVREVMESDQKCHT